MRTVTETITTNVYTFDELSDEAKEKVIAETRDSEMEINCDELVDCMKSAMNEMEIAIEDYFIGIDGFVLNDSVWWDDGNKEAKAVIV